MSGSKPGQAGPKKSAPEIESEPFDIKKYLCFDEDVRAALFEQPWNPVPQIDRSLEMLESGEYPSHFCLCMVRYSAHWALRYLERARRGEVLDYSRFELFQGVLVSRADTQLGALVRLMQKRDSLEAMQPELERVLGVCQGGLGECIAPLKAGHRVTAQD
jgi:hypothetical protein